MMAVGMEVRKGQDSFAYDLAIEEVVFDGVTVKGLNIKPDIENDGVFCPRAVKDVARHDVADISRAECQNHTENYR